MGIEEKSGTIDERDIVWLEAGSGLPVLMLHGLGGDGAGTYAPVMEHLADRRCYAPWARGHGKSGWADRYRIEEYGADAAAFIDEVIGEPVTIVGFSLGSIAAAYVAIHRPELVTALFLEDSPLLVLHDPMRHEHETYRTLFASIAAARRAMIDNGHDADWFRDQVRGFRVTTPGVDASFGDVLPDEAIALMAALMVCNDPAIFEPALTLPTAELVDGLPPEDLASIACPVHLLAGQWELGGSLPQEDVERWQQLMPHATARMIDNVGHAIRFAPHTLPIYLAELDRFLERSI